MASREILAGGAVVWRSRGGEVEVPLVYRPRYGDWSLPKGKLEPGESTRVAAWREVCEETGAHVALGRFLTTTRYPVGPDRKVVDYFAARYVSGSFTQNDEVDELRWLPVPAARALLTHDHDRAVLDEFTALPAELTTLLLVRHAKAGSRSDWSGTDESRPLSHNGRRQLAPILPLARVYGADRVYSAPLARCVQTVQAVATDLDASVAEEELLSEKTYDGTATVRRVLEIVAGGGVPVLCSQGGVIPDLVSRLATLSELSPGRRLTAKKGSVWALFFSETHLVAADYLERP